MNILAILLVIQLLITLACAFVLAPSQMIYPNPLKINQKNSILSQRASNLQMNLFEGMFGKKLSASAAHILVPGPDAKNFLLELKMKLNKKSDPVEVKKAFSEAARQYSTCPSAKKGGELGTFKQGQMVPAFDKVVFNNALNEVHGPVSTPFGYHLIYINEREEPTK